MNSLTLLRTIAVLSYPVLLVQQQANAGSNNGSIAQATGFSCDNRETLLKNFDSWCTSVNAKIIQQKCLVVLHMKSPVENCGWQGCGNVSLVNDRPKLSGNDVVEYGIRTPRGVGNLPPDWNYNPADTTILPKSPFPRHYLTVTDFASQRAKCAQMTADARNQEITSGSPLGRVCTLSVDVMSFNPYYFCMIKQGVINKD